MKPLPKDPKIVLAVSSAFPKIEIERLQALAPSARLTPVLDTAAEITPAMREAHALIGCPRNIFSDTLWQTEAAETLRWIHASGAGCEHFITPGLVASDVVLTNGRIIQGPEVSDHAVALLLALTRNLHFALRDGKTGPRPLELRRKTVVVVGLGGIGLLLAEKLHVFGMRVIGVNPQPIPMVSFVDAVVPPDQLLNVTADADAVICAAPLTPITRKLFDRSFFRAMKPTASFVNVSRGGLVDTNALIEALDERLLHAAALDVTDPEPLPADHALRRCKDVILTEHQAGLSDHNRQRSFDLIATNLLRFATGKPLLNIVDKALGY